MRNKFSRSGRGRGKRSKTRMRGGACEHAGVAGPGCPTGYACCEPDGRCPGGEVTDMACPPPHIACCEPPGGQGGGNKKKRRGKSHTSEKGRGKGKRRTALLRMKKSKSARRGKKSKRKMKSKRR